MHFYLLWAILAGATGGLTWNKPAYIIYDKSGSQVNYETMIEALDTADVILFGEVHNNAMAHWLELQVVKSLFARDNHLILGAEMFEADDQLVIDEYLAGLIEDRHLETEVKVWNNYKTDYKPLLTFAREQGLKFIATNVPRRYASMVARQGFGYLDSLSETALSYIAPLPVTVNMELSGYQHMLSMMGENSNKEHGNLRAENMVKAQSLKDATMAYFISQTQQQEGKFMHFNGTYHSDNFEGIYWYLKELNPDLSIAILTSIELENIESPPEGSRNVADFILALPKDMTKTY